MNPLEKKITRREFKKEVGIIAGTPLVIKSLPFYGTLAHAEEEPNIAVAKNGIPSQLLEAAIKTIGGMNCFIKSGQNVVIKANIAWARSPEQACTNNPELLYAWVKMCYSSGAARVAVWDYTCDNHQFTFIRTGLKEAGQKAGAEVLSGHGRNVYKKVEIPKGKKLRSAEVLKDVLEADVFINFPIPKHHFATCRCICYGVF